MDIMTGSEILTAIFKERFMAYKDREFTVEMFAGQFGENRSAMSELMTGKRPLTRKKALELARKSGDARLYEFAGETPPDENWLYLEKNWSRLSERLRRALREEATKELEGHRNGSESISKRARQRGSP